MNVGTQPTEQQSNAPTHSKYSRYQSGGGSGTFHPMSHVHEIPPLPVDIDVVSDSKVSSQSAMHYRGAPVYPTVYIPPYTSQAGPSLLPTPSCQPQPFEGYSSYKYSKSGGYGPKQPQPLMHSSPVYTKQYSGQLPPPQSQKYPRVTTPPARLQQLGRRPSAPGPQQQPQLMPAPGGAFYMSSQLAHKPPCQFGGGPRSYIYQHSHYGPGLVKNPFGFDYSRPDRQPGRRPSQRGGSAPPPNIPEVAKVTEASVPLSPKAQNAPNEQTPLAVPTRDVHDDSHSHTTDTSTSSTITPPRPTHSPSPTPSQVQLFGGQHQQQHQQHPSQRFNNQQRGGRPFTSAARGGVSKGVPRQQPRYKVNGIGQSQVSGKQQQLQSEDGGGDAPNSIGRLPLTPPGTPQQQSPNSSGVTATEQQVNESCHQMQALSL